MRGLGLKNLPTFAAFGSTYRGNKFCYHDEHSFHSISEQDNLLNNYDETELRAIFGCHYYCPFFCYSMPLFLRRREKKGKGEQW